MHASRARDACLLACLLCASGCIGDGAGGDDELIIAGLCRSCLCSQTTELQPNHDVACWSLERIIQALFIVSDVTLVIVYLSVYVCVCV